MASRAGALDREEALGSPHRPRATAGTAGFGMRAGLGARALAGLALGRGRHAYLRCLAGKGLDEAGFHIVAKVRAAYGTRAPGATTCTTTAASAHEFAEQIFEDVRHRRREFGTKARTAGTTTHAAFEGRMTEPVIGRLPLRILEHVVSFVDFLELVLGCLIARTGIGMKLLGELAEGALQLLLIGAFMDAQNFIVIAL